MSKHTPGPYHSVRGEAYPTEIYICHYNRRGQREAIAKILKPFSMDAEETAANARLFMAAPDLLEALSLCITDPGATCYTRSADVSGQMEDLERRLKEINRTAREAIAKATS